MGKSKELATRVGIDDNADATAITIDSSENVGIGATSLSTKLEVADSNAGVAAIRLRRTDVSNSDVDLRAGGGSDGKAFDIHVNQSNRMRIDSSGRVTKPSQPSFAAYVQNNSTYDANSVGNAYINYDAELYDTGNNHSAGIFTAPVAGVYYFRAEAYTNTHCTQSWFIVNGSRTNASDTVYRGTDQGNFSGNSTILKLAANDTVGFHPYRAGNSSMTVNANANHSWFRGMLIG